MVATKIPTRRLVLDIDLPVGNMIRTKIDYALYVILASAYGRQAPNIIQGDRAQREPGDRPAHPRRAGAGRPVAQTACGRLGRVRPPTCLVRILTVR